MGPGQCLAIYLVSADRDALLLTAWPLAFCEFSYYLGSGLFCIDLLFRPYDLAFFSRDNSRVRRAIRSLMWSLFRIFSTVGKVRLGGRRSELSESEKPCIEFWFCSACNDFFFLSSSRERISVWNCEPNVAESREIFRQTSRGSRPVYLVRALELGLWS